MSIANKVDYKNLSSSTTSDNKARNEKKSYRHKSMNSVFISLLDCGWKVKQSKFEKSDTVRIANQFLNHGRLFRSFIEDHKTWDEKVRINCVGFD